jgi:hypothetical protein
MRAPFPARPRPPCPHRPRPVVRGLALLAVAAALLGLGGGSALAATLTAVLEPDVITLGETAVLKVTIEGGNGQEAPRVPEAPGLIVAAAGSGRSFTFSNGRQAISTETTFSVTARRLGEFSLGPVTAVVGGRQLSDGPLKLRVVKSDDPAVARKDGTDKAAFLTLAPSKREVWVGETFVAETRLHAIGGRLQQAPQLQADGFVVGKTLEPVQEGNIRTNGLVYSRIRFVQPVTPARAGDLTLQATGCIIDIPVARRGGGGGGGGFFEDAFFNLRENRRFTLATEPVPLKVLPLPKTGVPAGFNGAVGDFTVALSASPTNLQAGDPVTVRIEISGQGNFDSVQLADPTDWAGFRLYPATGTFQTEDPLGLTGTKKFEQVVTPESAAITEIPALAFHYFSPQSGTYRTVRTKPVPLRVAPGAHTPSVPVPAGTTMANTATNATPSLRPLKPHLGLVVPLAPPLVSRPWFLGLLAFPMVAWTGVGWSDSGNSADAARTRRRGGGRSSSGAWGRRCRP